MQPARVAVGDRAREQLLDRPVETETTMKIADHSRLMPPYSSSLSAWLASEK